VTPLPLKAKGPRPAADLLKPKTDSGLRHEMSLEAFKRNAKRSIVSVQRTAQPLKQQPLRYRAGDNVVAESIAAIVEESKVAAKAAKRGIKRKAPFAPDTSPRKKARDNLAVIDSVLSAAEEQKARVEARATRKGLKRVHGQHTGASKFVRKLGENFRRNGSHANAVAESSGSFGQSWGDSGGTSESARTLLQVSRRTRPTSEYST
jgi:hypothetical protein